MGESEQLSALIADIYDAALDRSAWPSALTRTVAFVGGSGGGLFVRDAVQQSGNILCEVATEPGFSDLYFSKYIKLDPMNAAYLVIDVGEVYSNSMHIAPAEFFGSRFYKEWVRPQGWVDNIVVALEKSSTVLTQVAVFRGEDDGLADEPARDRMRLLVPHLRRAVSIGHLVDIKSAESATFADALDELSAGMFLVGDDARIVHLNTAGEAMLRSGGIVRDVGGRLVAGSADADRQLREVTSAAANGDTNVGARGPAIPLAGSDGERYVAHVLPLTSGARRSAGARYAAVAAIFVHKAALDRPSLPEAIATAFRLTPVELRVFLAIVEVGGAPDVARALGIAESTVKTHLGRLYAKTGAHRQADLVKIVAGFSSPLLG